jgi:hypothetical protein
MGSSAMEEMKRELFRAKVYAKLGEKSTADVTELKQRIRTAKINAKLERVAAGGDMKAGAPMDSKAIRAGVESLQARIAEKLGEIDRILERAGG